jgi:hypothetical protein
MYGWHKYLLVGVGPQGRETSGVSGVYFWSEALFLAIFFEKHSLVIISLVVGQRKLL